MEFFKSQKMYRNYIFGQPVILPSIISTIRNWFENLLYFETVLVAGTVVVFEEQTVGFQKTVVVVAAVEGLELKVCVYFR